MPYLHIRTNCNVAGDEQSSLLSVCSGIVADVLGKPESYVMVSLEQGQAMLFAGDSAPCAYLELKSIGLPGERTAEISARLCDSIQAALSIPQDRIYIEFADAVRHMWGWNGATF